ncbi:MAG: AzlD domain-containing protein [Actinomycetota bacterium]
MTWLNSLVLAIGVYAQRLVGGVAIDADRLSPRWTAVLGAVPLAIIAAVVALQTTTTAGSIELDARVYGMGAAALCAWRKLPLFVVVIVAAAVTATVRALG